jgi:protoheme IX farnesyltransferase
VTRYQKLVGLTLAATLGLVIVGVVVRATDSGMGCPDWPFCHGQVVPALGDFQAWAEWIHRLIAAVIGLLVLGIAVLALLDHRDRPTLVLASIGSVALVGFQAWLGEETVRLGNSGPSVTAHLATALVVVGLLAFLFVRAGHPARMPRRGSSRRFTLLAAFTALAAYAVLLFGSNVTARDAALVFPDWPLMGGVIIPPFGAMPSGAQVLAVTNALHRYVAAIVGVLLAATWLVAWRGQRTNRVLFRLVTIAALLYPLQAVVGAFQIWTQLAPWTQVVHVALAAFIWAAAVAAVFVSYYGARGRVPDGVPSAGPGPESGGAPGERVPSGVPGAAAIVWARQAEVPSAGGPSSAHAEVPSATGAASANADVPSTAGPSSAHAVAGDAPAERFVLDPLQALVVPVPPVEAAPAAPMAGRSRSATVRAYVALTKPRIIELLLITTIPAMVLATRDLPGVNWGNWGIVVFWTLIGGTLAAGAANAINQYLDRDIDLLMTRTRRRPLPAHSVEPEQALVFGIALGIISVGLLAVFVNLVAAFLTLLAIGFYVFVYTMLLKRTTTQNIVIGGAAGALPPVIGWAAVTGHVELPAIMLFALVFYWTPPHFWALSLRIAKDYAAAGIPMLPVVRGTAETTRQIFLYTILLVAVSLVFFAVAQMGLIYLVAALVLGAIFLWKAGNLAREGTLEGTTAGAIRLYKFSISYLTLLFLAVAVDALVRFPFG